MELIAFSIILLIGFYIVDKVNEIRNRPYIDELISSYENIQQNIPKEHQHFYLGKEIFEDYKKRFVEKNNIGKVCFEFKKEYIDTLSRYIYEQKAKDIYNNINQLYIDSYPDYRERIKRAIETKHYKYGNYYYRIFNKYKKYNNNLSANDNAKRLIIFEDEYSSSLFKLITKLIKEQKEREEKEKKKKHLLEQDKQYVKRYGKELAEYLNPKRKLSSKELGLRFERYVGYIYEQSSYNNVNYHGITKKKADGGIDLIIKTKDSHIIVQCKYYGKDNLIHENSINQFFSVFLKYKKRNPTIKVYAVFATAHDNLDDEARESLNIFKEITHKIFSLKYPIEYPTIKCNINNNDKRKIYHLPTDPNYDRIKIDINKGNFYCFTPSEAELRGFTRSRSNNRR